MADSDKAQYSQSESPSKEQTPYKEPWTLDNILKPHREEGQRFDAQRKAQPTPKGTFGWGGLTN